MKLLCTLLVLNYLALDIYFSIPPLFYIGIYEILDALNIYSILSFRKLDDY